MNRFSVRLAVAILLAAALPAALAQRLLPPAYYNFSTPVLEHGETVTGTLSESDGQNFKDGTRVHVYFLDGEQGEEISLALASDDFDTWLTVYDPDAQILDWNDDDWYFDQSATWQSALQLALPETGRYTVIVTAYSERDMGDYELLLTRHAQEPAHVSLVRNAEPELLTPGSQLTVTLDSDLPELGEGYFGPSRLYNLSVAEDMIVMISADGEELDAVLILYNELGTVIDWNDTVFNHEDVDNYWPARLLVLLEAGDYQLAVGGYEEYDLGQLQLTVTGYTAVD